MRTLGKMIVERRKDSRHTTPPITIEFDGKSFETTEWTLGGFLLNGYRGNRSVDQIMSVTIKVDAGAEKFEYVGDAMVARVDEDLLQLAAKFIDLDSDAVDTLDGWVTGRLRRAVKKKAENDAMLAAKLKRRQASRI